MKIAVWGCVRWIWIGLGFLISVQGHVSQARIQEITRMQEIEEDVDANTWVVFDIDNTLLMPTTYLGSDEWFYLILREYQNERLSPLVALQKAESVWNESQKIISVQAVEEQTPALISRLQKLGVRTLGLTARTADLADITEAQLRSIKINLMSDTADALRIDKAQLGSNHDVLFNNGIIFVGESNSKGKILDYILSLVGSKPSKVVYVDDKVKHVRTVDQTLTALGIPHICYRYGALDEKVKKFLEEMSYPFLEPSS